MANVHKRHNNLDRIEINAKLVEDQEATCNNSSSDII